MLRFITPILINHYQILLIYPHVVHILFCYAISLSRIRAREEPNATIPFFQSKEHDDDRTLLTKSYECYDNSKLLTERHRRERANKF